jgi:hypothetical protein
MTLTTRAWRLFWRSTAGRALARELDDTHAALKAEQARSAHAALLLTEPCPMCHELERERNNAQLELENTKADLDDTRAALAWLEKDFKVS